MAISYRRFCGDEIVGGSWSQGMKYSPLDQEIDLRVTVPLFVETTESLNFPSLVKGKGSRRVPYRKQERIDNASGEPFPVPSATILLKGIPSIPIISLIQTTLCSHLSQSSILPNRLSPAFRSAASQFFPNNLSMDVRIHLEGGILYSKYRYAFPTFLQ